MMPRPPGSGVLEGRCPDAASRLARFALLGLIGPIGDRLPGPDHGDAEIALARKTNRNRATVAILFARPAAKLGVRGERFEEARRRAPAMPWMAGARADRAECRGVDAVEPDLDAGNADAVAVDHLRGTDNVGSAPVGEEPGCGEAGERQTGEQHCAGAAIQASNHPVSPAG